MQDLSDANGQSYGLKLAGSAREAHSVSSTMVDVDESAGQTSLGELSNRSELMFVDFPEQSDVTNVCPVPI